MKDFLKLCLAAGCGGLTTITGLGCGGLLLLALIGFSGAAGMVTPKGALLVVDLDLPVADAPRQLNPMEVLPLGNGGPSVHPARLWEITDAIRRAAKDDDVSGVLLRGNVATTGLHSGWAALSELRSALLDFRASGKPLCSVATIYEEPTYYLASAAEHVWVDPMGGVLLNGFASSRMYFASALEKLGVEIQVTRVGRYKSAVEPFLADERSPEDREQTGMLLAAINDGFIDGVADSRSFDAAQLRAWMDEGVLMNGEQSVERGLADGALGHSDMIRELEDLLDVDEIQTVTLERYVTPAEQRERHDGAVAVIYAEGAIVDGESYEQVGGDSLARALRAAADNDDFEAVVLRVNSPGGSAIASEVILREVVALRGKKPVIVSMGSLAASGGYWIACQADHIVAEPTTITGSIGVFGMLPNAEGMLDKLGLTVDVVKTAKHADVMAIHRAKTPEEMETIQVLVDSIYDGFLDRVSIGRDMDRERVAEIAQGRVWSGAQAFELGLVDELGSLEDAIAVAKDRANLDGDAGLRFPQAEQVDAFDVILRDLARDGRDRPLTTTSAFANEFSSARRELEVLLGQGPVMARLPYLLRIH
jgi:protease IV